MTGRSTNPRPRARAGQLWVTALSLWLSGLVLAGAQGNKKPPTPLETGGERKLGVVYKTAGARELKLDLYYPVAGQPSPCPVVVYTHGGGWAAGSRFSASKGAFAPLFRSLTQHGFAIASVDYRLCSKGGDIRMRDCVTDSKDAVRFLVKNREALGIDPGQVFVFGDSAGGHIAQMLLLSPPDSLPGAPELSGVDYRIKAGVSWYGPCDFENIHLFNHDDRPDFKDRFGARILGDTEVAPEEKQRLYREMSPVSYLRNDSPPLLMIQGDKDTTIPVKHAHRMRARAEEMGAPVQTLIVENSGHNWRMVGAEIRPSRDEILRATAEFFTGRAKAPH